MQAQQDRPGIFGNVKGDLGAGLVVFLIAVPLCLGIALASGAPLFSGIVSGIIGGIVVGMLSKSQVSVSGPAAGLTAIVLAAVTELKAFDIFLCAVVIAGLIQLVLGIIRAGAVSNYFPSNVIEGMLAAIGIIIILKQIPHAFGFDKDNEGDFFFVEAAGNNTFSSIIESINFIHPGAIIIAVVSIGLLLLWERPFMKRFRMVPGALVAVLAGVAVNQLFVLTGSPLAIQQAHMVSLPIPNNVNDFIGQFTTPNLQGFANPKVWQIGAVIAIVGSIETLLCIEASDKLDPLKRYTSTNRELRAQGIGNMLSGFLGGLPMTSVIVRSSANINSGGRTKMSAIFHGVLLLVCAALIPGLLNMIPLASLAAILIMTGYKLCKPAVFKHMWKEGGITQFIPFIVTVVAVVFTDLLKGVALGMAVSIFFILKENMKVSYFYQRSSYQNGDIIKLSLAQEVSFLNKASIKSTLENLPENSIVIIDASNTSYIDFDVLDIIKEFKDVKAAQKGIRLSLLGFKNAYNVENTEHTITIQSNLISGTEQPTRTKGNQDKLLKQLTKV